MQIMLLNGFTNKNELGLQIFTYKSENEGFIKLKNIM